MKKAAEMDRKGALPLSNSNCMAALPSKAADEFIRK